MITFIKKNYINLLFSSFADYLCTFRRKFKLNNLKHAAKILKKKHNF